MMFFNLFNYNNYYNNYNIGYNNSYFYELTFFSSARGVK